MVTSKDAEMRERALEYLRKAYDQVGRMMTVKMSSLNKARPPSLQYRTRRDLLREFSSSAGAVSRFAVAMGIITNEDAAQILVEFSKAHPEIGAEDQNWRPNE